MMEFENPKMAGGWQKIKEYMPQWKYVLDYRKEEIIVFGSP